MKPENQRAVVVVEPEQPENTGFIARLASNFRYSLRIVDPGFNLSEARKTASNAQDVLRDTRIYDSVEDAVRDLDYVVGTKPGRGSSVKEFDARENTSIMIGRESSGLSNSELELCDAVVHIDAPGYESLNQSHAAGIVMHSFSPADKKGVEQGQKAVLSELLDDELLEEIVMRANPSRDEVNRLIGKLKD